MGVHQLRLYGISMRLKRPNVSPAQLRHRHWRHRWMFASEHCQIKVIMSAAVESTCEDEESLNGIDTQRVCG